MLYKEFHGYKQVLRESFNNVITTCSNPQSFLHSLFDSVMVMAEGRLAFMGDTKQALDFYKR